jgi:hypothetical protein
MWRQAKTYPAAEVNPDDEWGENFVMGDVPAGRYTVQARIGGIYYSREITVEEGKLTFVELSPTQ